MAQLLEKVVSKIFQMKYIWSNLGTQTLTDYTHQPVAWIFHIVGYFLNFYRAIKCPKLLLVWWPDSGCVYLGTAPVCAALWLKPTPFDELSVCIISQVGWFYSAFTCTGPGYTETFMWQLMYLEQWYHSHAYGYTAWWSYISVQVPVGGYQRIHLQLYSMRWCTCLTHLGRFRTAILFVVQSNSHYPESPPASQNTACLSDF